MPFGKKMPGKSIEKVPACIFYLCLWYLIGLKKSRNVKAEAGKNFFTSTEKFLDAFLSLVTVKLV